MHITKKQLSTSKPDLPIILETVFVTPIAPSPMTMSVKRLIRSIKWVFLKLNIFQKQEMVITATDSKPMTAYQTV